MIIDPVQLLVKTAANYIAFKAVKAGVDGIWNDSSDKDQYSKAAECVFCLNVWSNNPSRCPHCGCKHLKKRFRDYEYKPKDPNAFQVDANLTMGRK